MAPGARPAQSAEHDVGAVQPVDQSLSVAVADADCHSPGKHGLNLGRSRMQARRTSGSVRGAGSNRRPYSTTHSNTGRCQIPSHALRHLVEQPAANRDANRPEDERINDVGHHAKPHSVEA
jgi:hypothetical protein